jgi:uncharacterized protein (TIGR02599 family)
MSFRHSQSLASLRKGRAAFTLVEVLVSMTILIILLLVSAQVIGTVQSTWTKSNARVSQFREARIAFDIITRNLSQATLNSYVDYDNSYLADSVTTVSNTAPENYLRKSDLRFVCRPAANLLQQGASAANSPGHAVFFQAPLGVAHDPSYVGLDRLLCGRGYFVQYTSDEFFRPDILPPGIPRFRYRLMEFSPPAEKNLIYPATTAAPTGANTSIAWYEQAGVEMDTNATTINQNLTRPIADNIVALIVAPQVEVPGAGAGNQFESVFNYDSVDDTDPSPTRQGNQHRLPSLVKVILIAIDEGSADRLSQNGSPQSPPFDTLISEELEKEDAARNLNATMTNVANIMADKRVNYRIFSATVSMRGAKWGS